MTKAFQRNNSYKDDNFSSNSSHLRDENGAVGEHLRSHVHLTNRIHLKNHIHLHNPNMAERSLMRDLIVLQRSRSLRDPSTSPPSWMPANDCSVHRERRSVGIDTRKEVSQLSESWPAVGNNATLIVAATEAVSRDYDKEQRGRAAEESRGEETSARGPEVIMPENRRRYKEPSCNLQGKDRKLGKSVHGQVARLRTFSEQLEEVTNQLHYGSKKLSPLFHHDRPVEGPKENINDNFSGRTKAKKCRMNNARRSRCSTDLRGTHTRRSLPAASDLITYVPDVPDHTSNGEVNTELDASGAPINVCGIPWNWSRIHHRGKTFLDKAGRSLSCTMSESGPRETEVPIPQQEGNTLNTVPVVSNKLSPSTSSDYEVLPLLNEPFGSEGSDVNHSISWDYTGELGVFTNQSLLHGMDSDLASEVKSHNHQKDKGCHQCCQTRKTGSTRRVGKTRKS